MRLKLIGGVPNILLFIFLLLLFLYLLFFKSYFPKVRRKTFEIHSENDLLDDLPVFCEEILKSNYSKNSSLKLDLRGIEDRLLYSRDRCSTLKSMFKFQEIPFSEEEAEFPLAYGMIVYKNIVQVLFMLSSIYHPQNEYCVAVGENADSLFQNLLKDLADCFPNVHFMKRPPISWGSHEIINSAYGCLEFLSHLKTDWRYFQYLSGVDAPLRTNLEMVRIFKALNGSANVELKEYQEGRLRGKKIDNSPLPLFKSSLSALIPREAANFLASSLKPRELLQFLENTGIADEGFWGTLFGNKAIFPVPGSTNAAEWIEMRDYLENNENFTINWNYRYYMSRDQIWSKHNCHNYMKSGSCVYGVGDVPRLLKSRAMVAHKFYLKSQPEAYFCLLKEIRRRSEHPDPEFTTLEYYRELPQVEMQLGKNLSEVSHLDWIF